MDAQAIIILIAGCTLLLAVLGIAARLGYHAARIDRNEKDISSLNNTVTDSLRRLHEKIDALPCKNPGWKKEHCA